MIYYMATEKNKELLDFMSGNYIFSKNTYCELTAKDFMYLIKHEFRNITIDILFVDESVFKEGTLNDTETIETFDAFKLLYPESRIIILAEQPQTFQSELFISISFGEHLKKDIMQILENETNSNDEKGEDESVDNTSIEPNSEEILDEETIEMNQAQEKIPLELETVSEVKADAFLENTEENTSEIVNEIENEKVISKNIEKVKLSEGVPLLKNRVQERKESKKAVKQVSKLSINKCEILRQQWNCSNIIIALVGAERRTGTTTTAFQIAQWLNQSGAKVSYTEANYHYHLKKIAENEGFVLVDQHYEKNGIHYFVDTEFDQDSGRNFIILDLGSIQDNSDWVMKIIRDIADIVVLTATGKSYELEALDSAVSIISALETPCTLLINFMPEVDLPRLEDRYCDKEMLIINGAYEPNLMKPIYNVSEIFEGYRYQMSDKCE